MARNLNGRLATIERVFRQCHTGNSPSAVIDARQYTGKSKEQIEQEIEEARAYWGNGPHDILVIDR